MTINLSEFLPVLLYIALLVLVIVCIIFVLRLMKTLTKLDVILDDANRKMIKVDGLFTLIDTTTDYASNFSDKIISGISSGINFLLRRRKDDYDESEDYEDE